MPPLEPFGKLPPRIPITKSPPPKDPDEDEDDAKVPPGPGGTPLPPPGLIPPPPPPGIGVTEFPPVDIITDTGVGFKGIPKIVVRRDPLDVPADQLIQVTDLVGLKQTGYYQGRPYYGAVFFKDGLAYAGYYETAGQLIRVYATLQESIDGEVTTAPSAIQRQGTDVNSNNPRLNIPGTPQNLTE